MTETIYDRLVWVEIPATDLDRAKGFYVLWVIYVDL